MSRRVRGILAVIWGAVALLGSASVGAHTASDWYPAKWVNDKNVNWKFASGFPTGTAPRARVKNGAAKWNQLNQTMGFVFDSGADYASFSALTCPNTEQKDAVHWGTIDGPGTGAALATVCTFADAIGPPGSNTSLHSFQLKFDSAENWFTSDSGTPGSNQPDMESLAAHEFGHATGRSRTEGGTQTAGGDGKGHFVNSSEYCTPTTEANHHTMCTSTPLGTTWDRSLNTHDIDTFQNAY